jgi:hypothetical protein
MPVMMDILPSAVHLVVAVRQTEPGPLYRRAVAIGTSALVLGTVLYFVLIDPRDAS